MLAQLAARLSERQGGRAGGEGALGPGVAYGENCLVSCIPLCLAASSNVHRGTRDD